MNEAFGSIDEFKREVSDLSPKHKDAVDKIKDLVEQVEAQKQDYIVVSTGLEKDYIMGNTFSPFWFWFVCLIEDKVQFFIKYKLTAFST